MGFNLKWVVWKDFNWLAMLQTTRSLDGSIKEFNGRKECYKVELEYEMFFRVLVWIRGMLFEDGDNTFSGV